MDENDVRRGVRDGIIDSDNFGCGFLVILIECALIGMAAYYALGYFMDFEDGDSVPAYLSWVGWITGLVSFFLFFIPGFKGILVIGFSGVWAFAGYFAVYGMMMPDAVEIGLSVSPIPYFAGLFVFLMSWGIHSAFLD